MQPGKKNMLILLNSLEENNSSLPTCLKGTTSTRRRVGDSEWSLYLNVAVSPGEPVSIMKYTLSVCLHLLLISLGKFVWKKWETCWIPAPARARTRAHTHTLQRLSELLREPFSFYNHLPLKDREHHHPRQIPRVQWFFWFGRGEEWLDKSWGSRREGSQPTSAPTPPTQVTGGIGKGMPEPGHRPSEHSFCFVPAWTTQRENRANLVNVNTMAIFVTGWTNLAFILLFSLPTVSWPIIPSSTSLLRPESAPCFPFSTLPGLRPALHSLSANQGQPSDAPGPQCHTRQTLDNGDPVARKSNFGKSLEKTESLERLPSMVLCLHWSSPALWGWLQSRGQSDWVFPPRLGLLLWQRLSRAPAPRSLPRTKSVFQSVPEQKNSGLHCALNALRHFVSNTQ